MRHVTVHALLAVLLLAGAAPLHADEQRQTLARERLATEQRYTDEERGCSTRFAVVACVEEVRARRRAALATLREQELRLDEAERQRRAEERRAAVARKQVDAARRAAPQAEPALPPREPAAAAPLPPLDLRAAGLSGPTPQEAAEAARRAESLRLARERAEVVEARVRERLARQEAELAAKGRQPDTLPRPGAAASAASAASAARR